jgi:hypothetical protein
MSGVAITRTEVHDYIFRGIANPLCASNDTKNIARESDIYVGTVTNIRRYQTLFTFRTYDVNGNFTGTEIKGTIVATRIIVN